MHKIEEAITVEQARIAWGETATKKLLSPETYRPTVLIRNPMRETLCTTWLPPNGGEGWYIPTKQQWDKLVEIQD